MRSDPFRRGPCSWVRPCPYRGPMAFLRLAFFPGGTAAHWDTVVQAVGDVAVPDARRAFAAGPVDGGWQVMQLWDTRADLERFNRDVFFPSVARLPTGGFPQPPVVRDVDTADAWVEGHRVP